MKLKSLFIAILTIVVACDNRNEPSGPKETLLLTLSVDASYLTGGAYQDATETDDWIIVHGEDGTLLASENFESNQESEVTTNKPANGNITVTHLRYISFEDGTKSYSLRSYTDISKGKQIILNHPEAPPKTNGYIDVFVSDVDSYVNGFLNTPFTSRFTGSWNGGTNILDLRSDTYMGVSKYVVSVSSLFESRYKVLENVVPDETYSFSFNEMNSYEHKAVFNFPPTNYANIFSYGSDPNGAASDRYLMTWKVISNTTSQAEANYIDGLSNYRTDLTLSYPDRSYRYLNQGSLPDGNVTWPQKSDFNVLEKSLSNFSATSSKSFVWRRSGWNYRNDADKTSVSWSVASPSGSHKINELPGDILNVHPVLALGNMVYRGTAFFVQSPGYELAFHNAMQAGPEPAGETVEISF